jgi:Spy/CpxP family protein refolding chaperone
MKFWIMIFSAALFAGGTCLGVALQPRLAPGKETVAPAALSAESGSWRHRGYSVSQFVSELGLSEDQDRRLDSILEETQRDTEAFHRAMRSSQERSRDRIREILTEEQRKKLDDLMEAERRKRTREEARKSAAKYARLLSLTDEQARAFEQAAFEARLKRSGCYRSARGDYEKIRSQLRGVREEQNETVRKFLTPEQYQKYQEIQEFEH